MNVVVLGKCFWRWLTDVARWCQEWASKCTRKKYNILSSSLFYWTLDWWHDEEQQWKCHQGTAPFFFFYALFDCFCAPRHIKNVTMYSMFLVFCQHSLKSAGVQFLVYMVLLQSYVPICLSSHELKKHI